MQATDPPTLDKEYFNNAYCGMDDWRYEMRREMQEIVVSFFFLYYFITNPIMTHSQLISQKAWRVFRSLFSLSSN